MRIALDTNGYRKFLEGDQEVVMKIRTSSEIGLPVPVVAELRYGFLKGNRRSENEALFERFLDSPRVQIIPCDERTALQFAQLKLQLCRQGTPIPIQDVWIASVALQHGLSLLTFDSDFDQIPQLSRA